LQAVATHISPDEHGMGGNIGRPWNPLVKKLSLFSPLSDEDVGLLDALRAKEGRFLAGAIIAVEGEVPRSAFVVTRGMAFLRPARVPGEDDGPFHRHNRADAYRRRRPGYRHRHRRTPSPD
jgi:hypothetical protein